MNICPSVPLTGTCPHKEAIQPAPHSLPSFLAMEMFKLQFSIWPPGLRPNFKQVGMEWVLVVYFLIALSWATKIL
jgi:hypothetical protein